MSSRRRRSLLLVLGLLLVVPGCLGPRDQVQVGTDPTSGQLAIAIGLCTNERVEQISVTPLDGARDAPSWSISRTGDDAPPTPPIIVLGTIPSGFSEQQPWQPPGPQFSGGALVTVNLDGGAVVTDDEYLPAEVATLGGLDAETGRQLTAAAEDNCALLPTDPPVWITLPLLLLLAAAAWASMRQVRAHRSVAAREWFRSPWYYATVLLTLTGLVILVGSGHGSSTEASRYLLMGAAGGAIALLIAWSARGLRKREIPIVEWLLVAVLVIIGLPILLLIGSIESFLVCSGYWALDCTPSWFDRLCLLAPIVAAWPVALRVAEGYPTPGAVRRRTRREPTARSSENDPDSSARV